MYRTLLLFFYLFSAYGENIKWPIPVTTPDNITLASKLFDKDNKLITEQEAKTFISKDIKVIREVELTAEIIGGYLFYPEMKKINNRGIMVWGYNGRMPGPTIEANEGEILRIKFKNNWTEPTTLHSHGLILPINMDGAAVYSHPPIKPGGTYIYEYELKQHGTFMYHSGFSQSKQVGLGSAGFLIIHPKDPNNEPQVEHDFALMLQTWNIPPYSYIPDTMDMAMLTHFTFNGKASPATSHLKVKEGDRVRIRMANLSMMPHPIHLHGHDFWVTATGAGRNPTSSFVLKNSIELAPGQTVDIEFTAQTKGQWMFHCHILHHIMNDMDIPMLPTVMMDHGGHEASGMHTVLEVIPR